MNPRFSRSVEIPATPEHVWNIVSDVVNWSAWTATVSSTRILDVIDLGVGARAIVVQPGSGARTWSIDEWSPPASFAWSTRVGSVRMKADHRLSPSDLGTRVELSIEMSGPGARILAAASGSRIRRMLDAEASGLAAYSRR